MEAKDLRIGNYVNYENRPFEVIEISPISLVVRKKIGDIFEMQHRALDVAQPIELAEELLVKIGFEGEMYEFCLHTKDANIIVNLIENRVEISYYGNRYRELLIKYNVKYLHQLQNALYLLTNEELEVEL